MANVGNGGIFQGTELKFQLDITSEGFSMIDDDFKIIVKNKKVSKEIRKEDMILTDDEKFLFTLDTAEFGTGDYIVTTIAYVPDEDFEDGLRTEVQKQLLCSVTA